MAVAIIVAYDEGFVIGNEGKIPWYFSEDMKHFKKTTSNCPVVMGRKTYDSLPPRFKPLPNRPNIVLSRNNPRQGVFWARSIEEAVDLFEIDGQDIFIAGGGEVYREALNKNIVDYVVASEVKGNHIGDTFFPDLKQLGWIGEVVKEFSEFTVKVYRKP